MDLATITHKITLSTTDFNLVGDIKVRQADDETQVFDAVILEHGMIKNFEGLKPFFCLMAREITGQGVSEEPVTDYDGSKGTLKYTVSANAMQMVGRNEAYFSFRKESSSGRWVEQFSTRSFFYVVEKSIYTQPFKDSNYWFTFNELYRKFMEYQDEGKISWEEFVDQNRDILESVDPGGVILTELIDARKDEEGETFDVLKENVNSKLSKKGGKFDQGAEVIFPTTENLKLIAMPAGQGLGLIPDTEGLATARFALQPNFNAIDQHSTGGLIKLFAVPFEAGNDDYLDMGIYYSNPTSEPGQNDTGAFYINSKAGVTGKYLNKNADIIFSFQDGEHKAMRIVYSPTRGANDRGLVVIGPSKSAYSVFGQVGLEMQKDIFFHPDHGIRFPKDENTATTLIRYNSTTNKIEFLFEGERIMEFSNTGTSNASKVTSITSGTSIDASKGSIFTTNQMISTIANPKEGQQITIVMGDTTGGVSNTADIFLKGNQNFSGKTMRSSITLLRMKTYWVEIARTEI